MLNNRGDAGVAPTRPAATCDPRWSARTSAVGRPGRKFVAVARAVRGEGKPLLPRRGGDLAVEADVREHRLAAVLRRVLDEEVEQSLGFGEVDRVAGRLPEE